MDRPPAAAGSEAGEPIKTTVRPNGIVERRYADGTSEAAFPDGIVITTFPDGTVRTVHPDGVVVVTDPNGVSTRTAPPVEEPAVDVPVLDEPEPEWEPESEPDVDVDVDLEPQREHAGDHALLAPDVENLRELFDEDHGRPRPGRTVAIVVAVLVVLAVVVIAALAAFGDSGDGDDATTDAAGTEEELEEADDEIDDSVVPSSTEDTVDAAPTTPVGTVETSLRGAIDFLSTVDIEGAFRNEVALDLVGDAFIGEIRLYLDTAPGCVTLDVDLTSAPVPVDITADGTIRASGTLPLLVAASSQPCAAGLTTEGAPREGRLAITVPPEATSVTGEIVLDQATGTFTVATS